MGKAHNSSNPKLLGSPPGLAPKRIVTIGGGTGQFTLLSGLKRYSIEISAIVSMADDGSSTGILRDELGVLPPGDVRQCLVALSDASEELRDLMNYRFENGGLQGHTFGNIFLSALEKTSVHSKDAGGSAFLAGVEHAMKILNVQGRVIPVTGDDARLKMELCDGTILHGEEVIEQADIQSSGVKKIFYNPLVRANPKALEAIRNADVIAIGPGSFYESVLSILSIKDIAKALSKTRAKIIFNTNLTNKRGHTSSFSAEDYATIVEEYIGKGRIDFVTLNTKNPPKELLERYEKKEGEKGIVRARNAKHSWKLVKTDIIGVSRVRNTRGDRKSGDRSFIRHDPDKLARIIVALSEFAEFKSIFEEVG